METVFITVHDLSLDARIRFCSDSIEYVLGYTPAEVRNKSCWEYFHPDEIPFAKDIHARGIALDKAASLNYCRIKAKNGDWVGCECVFTVVYDVLVGCTSVYTGGPKAHRRATDSHNVQRIFTSSPRDPRYHMLSYLSNKFYQDPKPHSREPRAALFLNRFSRTSTVMYATTGVKDVLGIDPDQLQGKSFYYMINEQCLPDSVKCLESAKSNDSIAYLRFRYRNPTQQLSRTHSVTMSDLESDEDEDGGVAIPESRSSGSMRDSPTPQPNGGAALVDGVPQFNGVRSHHNSNGVDGTDAHDAAGENERSSSDQSMDQALAARDALFDRSEGGSYGSLSSNTTPDEDLLEIEAVISCTSDGLVVVLRKAHQLVPPVLGDVTSPHYEHGMFASPWAQPPAMLSHMQQTTMNPAIPFPSMADPEEAGLMAAIRDVAVFAWSLTGINGSLAEYARGTPVGDATPPGGLPVWDPNATSRTYEDYNGFSGSRHRPVAGMGEPRPRSAGRLGGADEKADSTTSSDDEVLWKRAPTMAPWRRPKRRAHDDAFGEDTANDADGEDTGRRGKKISKSGGHEIYQQR